MLASVEGGVCRVQGRLGGTPLQSCVGLLWVGLCPSGPQWQRDSQGRFPCFQGPVEVTYLLMKSLLQAKVLSLGSPWSCVPGVPDEEKPL